MTDKVRLFIATLVLIPLPLFGAEVDDAVVTNFGATGSGKIWITIDKTIREPGCNRQRFDVPGDHPLIDTWSSIALAALASGKKVKIRTNGCLGASPTMDDTDSTWFYIKNY